MKRYNAYINFLCDLIIMDMPIVNYHHDGFFYDTYKNEIEPFQLRDTAKSTAVPKNNTIYIDLDKFSNEIDIYIALTHEVRHCGQYQAIMNDDMDDFTEPSILEQWKKELQSYKPSDIEGYENQAVELDANAFTWLICRVVFGIELQVDCDQELFNKYKMIISELYSVDEIKECLKYSNCQISKRQA